MRVNSSGTSAAHLGDGDGCRGYRPGALRVHLLMEACAVGLGGVTAFRGFPAAAAGPQDRGRTSVAAGWAVTVSSLTGAAEAQLELGVASPPPAGTAVYFKLMLTPRSRSSINCEQFNQSVSSCLKIFE